MCGSCLEQTLVLDILKRDVSGKLKMRVLRDNVSRYFYLRETPDFLAAMNRVKRSQAQKGETFSSEVPHQVVLYRGLEILVTKGFTSSAYQKLLAMPVFREAITALCSVRKRKKFTAATTGRDIAPLKVLYDAKTYLDGESSRKLATEDVLTAGNALLKHYHSWWLEGIELQKEVLMATMDDTGIEDPDPITGGITGEERSRFTLLCRAIYFSILLAGNTPAEKEMLRAIALHGPAGTSSFEGEDLWLQRTAALKLYDLEGFDTFLSYLPTIRATNYYYLDIARGFSPEQKLRLLDAVRLNPKAKRTDDLFSLTTWLEMVV